jgi:hypothetical protein
VSPTQQLLQQVGAQLSVSCWLQALVNEVKEQMDQEEEEGTRTALKALLTVGVPECEACVRAGAAEARRMAGHE